MANNGNARGIRKKRTNTYINKSSSNWCEFLMYTKEGGKRGRGNHASYSCSNVVSMFQQKKTQMTSTRPSRAGAGEWEWDREEHEKREGASCTWIFVATLLLFCVANVIASREKTVCIIHRTHLIAVSISKQYTAYGVHHKQSTNKFNINRRRKIC